MKVPTTLLLDGKRLDARIEAAITDGTRERTMDGSSSLQLGLRDPARVILRSAIARSGALLTLEGEAWALAGVSLSGSQLQLTFEAEAAAWLARFDKPRKVAARRMTRAQFAASLCHEAGVRMVGPDAKRRAIANENRRLAWQRGGADTGREDSWEALGRLASDVSWRRFVRGGALWFVPDAQLMDGRLVARLGPSTLGVDGVDFDLDVGKRAAGASVSGESRALAKLRPGDRVALSGLGPADGDWLVSTTSETMGKEAMSCELVRAAPAKPDPKPEQVSGGGRRTTPTLPAGSDPRYVVVAWALQWKGQRYTWGAHHGDSLAQLRGARPPFDCSSFVAAAWAQVGIDIRGTTYSQMAALRVRRDWRTGHGVPPGGWQTADLIYPSDHHVAMATGRDTTIQAECTACGIREVPVYSSSLMWARYVGGEA